MNYKFINFSSIQVVGNELLRTSVLSIIELLGIKNLLLPCDDKFSDKVFWLVLLVEKLQLAKEMCGNYIQYTCQ